MDPPRHAAHRGPCARAPEVLTGTRSHAAGSNAAGSNAAGSYGAGPNATGSNATGSNAAGPNAARVVREVGDLSRQAKEAGKGLATLSLDTEVRFRSAADRAAFTHELTDGITKLVAKYHDDSSPGGRAHRLMLMAHPLPYTSPTKE